MSTSLRHIAEVVGGRLLGTGEAPVTLTMDSRSVAPGVMFAAVKGESFDGHDFIDSAISAGATSLLVEHDSLYSVPSIVVDDVRSVLGLASSAIHDNPSSEIQVIGVTGTNGKTSVVQLLDDIARQAGDPSEVYGTLTGARTTAEAPELQEQLRRSADGGAEFVMMEVSSHALAMNRVKGVTFEVAIFTNLSHDHLDFHGSMEDYFEAKARLFIPGVARQQVINADDPYGQTLIERCGGIGFSLSDAQDLKIVGAASHFTWRGEDVRLNLIGTHNVMNALAAATAAEALGIAVADIAAALSESAPVKGRLQIVSESHPFVVAVDYAHTPDALAAVARAAREISGTGKVILVFGCGGDRDSKKRPKMGAIAEEMADLAILTTDNPRSEDPQQIFDDVLDGLADPDSVLLIEDRSEAIHKAVGSAAAGDVVVVAGKGHETGQYVMGEVLEFDDVQVAKEALEALT